MADSTSTSTATAVDPVTRSLAPWSTKAECYWLFLTLSRLPEGVYDALESGDERCVGAKKNEDQVGKFVGGLGVIMIVRYRDTPVGPYDELMIIPGNFTIPTSANTPPKIPKKALRIARIYVSQRTTTYNGRLNWNIPKHLARFDFSAPVTPAGSSPPESLTVKVFTPGSKDGDGVNPFFACTLKPWRWVPSVPVSSRWLPLSTVLAQPPVPEAPGFKAAVDVEVKKSVRTDEYDINPDLEESILAGTEDWCLFPITSYAPRARGCWVTVHETGKGGSNSEVGDQAANQEAVKSWPQDVRPWSIGAWMEDAELGIPEPLKWKL
ncbi:hypothetical protein BU24DRAFT_345038 [Aaosphaeria arxii CBS 175.79]|uniref:Uncharacterized protein n=1 Tax=Aaosphaeria arxii CBS 175.79 TaxID=1450172 RepID=A0A6A5XWC1_9PLEO|nr:uncharacterized protein BU24DRAFT_345038 [Aaosphaeria arxii CBS 175.79]KAF2017618.1 hypothetical protein BU24DRAFT_345038 [Aaosphaeria arxii CBS 175.79]